MLLRMLERLLTVVTCSSFRVTVSKKLIRTAAACSPRFLRLTAAARGLHGLKGHCGWGNIGTGGSINSILAQGRFFVPSNPIASLRELLGSMASSGTPLLKATKATCGTSTRQRERAWGRSTFKRGEVYRGS